MKHLARSLLALVGSLMLVLIVSAVILAPAALADDQESNDSGSQTDKQKAKEERIEEYLRKKEQRLAEQENTQKQKAAESGATETTAATAGAAPVTDVTQSKLPRELAEAQDAVRHSSIGQDPTVQRYLELIEAQEASPYQLAAFANFLSDSGMVPEAVVYYSVALSIEKDDPILWVNLGTLHRKLGALSQASSAYNRALHLDPNNALAHYNLGTVLDEQGKYEDAIEAYTVALMLEPKLGDPQVNPQAANNERLLAVKLMLYKQPTGPMGLPLVDIPEGELSDEAQKEEDPGD
jgi:tetratricopeptide (TPR) repeat protein